MTDKVLTDYEVDLLIEYALTRPSPEPDDRWCAFQDMAESFSEILSQELGSPVEVFVNSFGPCGGRDFFLSLPENLSCATTELTHVVGQAVVLVNSDIREHLCGFSEGPEAESAGAYVAGLFLGVARQSWTCLHPCAFSSEVRQVMAAELASQGYQGEEASVVCFEVNLPGGRLGTIKLVATWEAFEELQPKPPT